MNLAGALQLRADAQKRLAQLRQRILLSARHQEGDQPPEDPQALLEEIDRVATELEDLIRRINRTNAATTFDDERSLSDALAARDVLSIRRSVLADVASAASVRQDRLTRSEVKFVAALDVRDLQRQVVELSKGYRELDAAIQAKNWETDLIE